MFKSVILIALVLILGADSALCGSNCPSNACPSCICGSLPSAVNITHWCRKHTWNQACCECIVQNESGGNRYFTSFNTGAGTYNAGLWNINSYNWASCGITLSNACNLNKNLMCAKQIYAWGSNTWKFWSSSSVCGCTSSN